MENKKEKSKTEEKKSDHDEKHEKKEHVKIDNDPDKKIDVKGNPWILASIILGVVVIILLVMMFNGTSFSSTSISSDEAGEKVTEFLNTRTGGGVEFVSSEEEGELYKVTVSYQNQEVPVYITKDGAHFIQGVIPIDEVMGDEGTDNVDNNKQQQPPQNNIPKLDKPEVELFVMSYCPFGTQAEKGIIPVYELLGDKIDSNIRFVYYAMHGEDEVTENLNQYCIQKEQNDKYLDYLTCFLDEGDGEGCIDEVKINKAKLKSCTSKADKEFDITKNLEDTDSYLSGKFPMFNTDLEANQKYEVGGSPTLVINGVQASSGRDSASYLKVICEAFNEPPEECNEELSSASPSPGFGFDSTSTTGATADATCG